MNTLWHGSDAIRLYSAITYLDHPTSPSLPDPNSIPHIPYMPLGTRHTRLGDNLPIPIVLPNLGGVSGLVVAQAEDESDEERDKGKAENDKPKSIHGKALVGMHTYRTIITDDWRQELASASNELTRKAIWKYPFVAPPEEDQLPSAIVSRLAD
jgi:hypothetical protein